MGGKEKIEAKERAPPEVTEKSPGNRRGEKDSMGGMRNWPSEESYGPGPCSWWNSIYGKDSVTASSGPT